LTRATKVLKNLGDSPRHFGSNNQELIDSTLRLLREGEASSGNYEIGIDLI
jgi:hypothetical protein